jgi:hypothetical protein
MRQVIGKSGDFAALRRRFAWRFLTVSARYIPVRMDAVFLALAYHKGYNE